MITVAYITDENYAMPTYVSVYSLIRNKDKEDKVRIYLIGNNLSRESKEYYLHLKGENVEVRLLCVDSDKYVSLSKTCHLAQTIHVSDAALFKMDLPQILEGEDKVLYIDGDTLIQGSLKDLYETDVEKVYVAAVEEPFDKKVEGFSSFCDRIGLKRGSYFNSGVMLLNLAKMREENVSGKLLEYRIHRMNYFMDQDCLNAVLGEKIIFLPCIYNFMSTISDLYDANELGHIFFGMDGFTIESCIAEARILHLTDRKKPWIYNMPWYSKLFFSYYSKTPYRKQWIDLKSPLKVLRDENQDLRRRMNAILSRAEFVFPYDRISKGCRIVLYGAGKMGQSFYRQIQATQYCEIAAWVDIKGSDAGENVDFPGKISEVSYDYVLIAIGMQRIVDEVKNLLKNTYQVESGKMITKFCG